jgi:hypothetical protein
MPVGAVRRVRGQPPRRRNVPSVMGWAVEAVTDYVDNIRPGLTAPIGRSERLPTDVDIPA